MHHIYNKKKSKVTASVGSLDMQAKLDVQDDEEHKIKADYIVTNVLAIIDKDRDGKISLAELDHVGLDALPNFDNAEGHHYDVESGPYICNATARIDTDIPFARVLLAPRRSVPW